VKWEILCLTMNSREQFLARLMAVLFPQIVTGVDIRIRTCDPLYTLGQNRDMLRRASGAEYQNFVDDDDLVPADYVSSILPLLDRDYVGFQVQGYADGIPDTKLAYHSLRYSEWSEDENGYYRDISHLNPMRRELAMLEPMEGGHGEDRRWADRMRARGALKTEHYIPRVMYSYYFRSHKNRAEPCPKCKSESTVRVETCSHCNHCSFEFNPTPAWKSCLWV
jgi:hypothetical protein